jgi:predicted Zn-dependent protease
MGRRILLIGLSLVLGVMYSVGHAEERDEIGFGNFADQQQVSNNILVLDDALNERITAIGNRVAKAAGKPDVKYTFRIVNNPVVNAFATSGGFVYICTGLLSILERPDEVAAVLAHEIAHSNESHAVKRLNDAHQKQVAGQNLGRYAGLVVGAFVGSVVSSDTIGVMMDLGSSGGQLLGGTLAEVSSKGYAKEQELEADRLALQYLRGTGYDPSALVRVLKKFQKFRDQIEPGRREEYASALINKSPGLEERTRHVEEILSNPAQGRTER